jgi:polyisoprenoid-binding protein YceI
MLLVRVHKDGVAARLAHNHVVWAKEFSGSITYDPAAPEATIIKVDIVTKGLNLDDPALKKQWKEDPLSEGDRADVTKNMFSEDQLNVNKYPAMSFVSTGVTKNEDGTLAVKGNFTMHGTTQPISFNAKIEPDGTGFKGHAEFSVKQSNYGFKPFSAMFGAIKNKDEINFILDLVAVPK